MKIKDIIRVLQGFDPEIEPNFCLGSHRNYRKICAEQVLNEFDGDGLLTNMSIISIKSEHYAGGDEEVNIILQQNYFKEEYFDTLIDEYLQKQKKEDKNEHQ